MKKRVPVLIILSLIISTAFAAAADVAYIYKTKVDKNIINTFEEEGLTVDLIKDKHLPASFNQYKLIYVGDENIRNENLLPINNFPSIVANYYHTDTWGLTDNDGASQLASNHKLSVRKNNLLIQVYTQATDRGIALPYYYLDKDNKAQELTSVAMTETTSSGSDFGDVIAYASPGTTLLNNKIQTEKLCFFGVAKSKFWTPAAKNLFVDCLNFVAGECTTNNDCPATALTEPFCQDGNIYETETSYTCQNGALAQCIPDDNLILIEECDFGCSFGECIKIACFDDLDCDDSDALTIDTCENKGTAESVCTHEDIDIVCSTDEDCGSDNFLDAPFCIENNVTQEFQSFSCVNGGSADSECILKIENETLKICDDFCSEGECLSPSCILDEDCDDQNPLTFDECINPNLKISECRNTPINCAEDLDCGFNGFIGESFCTFDNVTQNFQTSTCSNPGTLISSCSIEVAQTEIQQCDSVCSEGACTICNQNSDCADNNENTVDICNNPGELNSFCTNPEIITSQITCATDEDCGPSLIVSNLFCSLNSVNQLAQTHTCKNANTTESYCSSAIEQVEIQVCDNFCSEGICIDISCFNNAECDDSDANTEDICIKPGTPESSCINNPFNIACFNNEDCGINQIISQPFCSLNKVNRLIQAQHCNNAGKPESYCSSSIEQEISEICNDLCTQGECVEVECFDNSDCNDRNDDTIDTCINPGQIDSSCLNEISCLNECVSGARQCSGAGYQVCGNYDSDSCLEWSGETACTYGCSDGFCNSPPPVCEDECSPGARQCSGAGYQVCGNYDSDSCLEWSGTTNCGFGKTCLAGQCI